MAAGEPIDMGVARTPGIETVRALNALQTTLAEMAATSLLILDAIEALAPTTLGVSTVAGLPTIAASGQGARRLVTDANATTFASIVAGGGANIVPVFNNGTNWIIG